jgi:hypothetical protein
MFASMIDSIPREVIVETLLNSLEAERYVRGPLLLTVIDELSGEARFGPAAEFAGVMLARLELVGGNDFVAQVAELRALVQDLARGGRLAPPAEARARPTPPPPPLVAASAA